MMSLVRAVVRERTEELRREFEGGQPFRHVVVDEFLEPEFCRELMREFPPFESQYALNERGEPGRKAVVTALAELGPAYARFDRLMKDREFLEWMGRVTGVERLLYDADYVGGGTHENLDGQELDWHVDFNFHPRLGTHRRLNLIVFLNERWEESWGGCLELLREPNAAGAAGGKTVVPVANRAVVFETTESSWHGFRRVQLPPAVHTSRRSIAVYFYTATRPQGEQAPSHGTVYYQRPLPDWVRAGHTLSNAEAQEIEMLVARRDEQIRFLYGRELKFSRLIESLTASPSRLRSGSGGRSRGRRGGCVRR
jgi:Rps23 Pro-64 3,4-dihydroxylase Tpa1-like proline 4-hydroxylase